MPSHNPMTTKDSHMCMEPTCPGSFHLCFSFKHFLSPVDVGAGNGLGANSVGEAGREAEV